jgi:hypothetical protein
MHAGQHVEVHILATERVVQHRRDLLGCEVRSRLSKPFARLCGRPLDKATTSAQATDHVTDRLAQSALELGPVLLGSR